MTSFSGMKSTSFLGADAPAPSNKKPTSSASPSTLSAAPPEMLHTATLGDLTGMGDNDLLITVPSLDLCENCLVACKQKNGGHANQQPIENHEC